MTQHFDLERPAADPALWPLDPAIHFLNHGSFGSCPGAVLAFQQSLRSHLERQPVQFLVRELEPMLDATRRALGSFVGANPDDLGFVPNATAGVNTVLRSLEFKPGDELLVTDHEYNACRNALDYVAGRSGARVCVASVPFPLRSPSEVTDAVLACVSDRTRIALLDHVTSQTGLIMPIGELSAALAVRGVEVLVDGAHAPGMIALNLAELRVAYYTGNCHKWICAPKGAGFLYVHPSRQDQIRPLSISHGANSPRKDRSRFLIEFGWTGTWDPSAMLSVPQSLRYMDALLPGGWPATMRRNRELALAARDILCETLGVQAPCPDSMIGSLASVPLPDAASISPPLSPLYTDPLQDALRDQFSIEVPVVPWPGPPQRVLRISAQLYNRLPQYRDLARALQSLVSRPGGATR
jgi:isopenicillin-N epimerase